MTAYAELVAASNFSFLRGASKPEELAATAAALGYKALAICDRNTVAGVVRAHKPAKQLGLQYIPGCRLVLQQDASAAPVASQEFPLLRESSAKRALSSLRAEGEAIHPEH